MLTLAAFVLFGCGSSDESVAFTEKMVTEAGAMDPAEAEFAVSDGFGSWDKFSESLHPGSVRHVVSVSTSDGWISGDIFVWKVDEFLGRDVDFCWKDRSLDRAGFGGGGAGCEEFADGRPVVSPSLSTRPDFPDVHSIAVLDAPTDATSVAVTTGARWRVDADLVDGAAMLIWRSSDDQEWFRVEFFDESMSVLSDATVDLAALPSIP